MFFTAPSLIRSNRSYLQYSPNHHYILPNNYNYPETDLKRSRTRRRRKMMNLIAISLVVTSLAGAGVLSPTPETQQKQAGNTIVREGHRVIVVEYDQDGYHNTKVSISPEQTHDEKFANVESGVLDNAKEKIKEAASVLPNMGQGLSQGPHDAAFLHAPRELICDAYGKCKHKIAGAMGKAKDKISETAHEAIDKQKEMAGEVGDTFADAVGKAKETVSHRAHDVQERTKESVEKAKDTLKEAKDVGKTMKNDIAGNVSEGVGNGVRGVKEALKRIGSYLGSVETLNSLMGVFNLLGFATAYGMCVWITFISSYVLSRAMPRQQFGVVQSKIYPVYFRAMAYSIGLALLGHVFSHGKRLFPSKAEIFQAYNLLASLLTVLVNSNYLEPRATKVMFERMKIEKEEGRGREDITAERQHSADPKESATTLGTANTKSPSTATEPEQDAVRSQIIRLNDKLKRLNSYSSFLNILNLMSLTWHLVYLAQRLQLCS